MSCGLVALLPGDLAGVPDGCGAGVTGVCPRLALEAVRVGVGFSTMRMGSRSELSVTMRGGALASGGPSSAETEMRWLAGGADAGVFGNPAVGG